MSHQTSASVVETVRNVDCCPQGGGCTFMHLVVGLLIYQGAFVCMLNVRFHALDREHDGTNYKCLLKLSSLIFREGEIENKSQKSVFHHQEGGAKAILLEKHLQIQQMEKNHFIFIGSERFNKLHLFLY